MKMLIRGGCVIDPASGMEQTADLLIEDGVIAKIAPKIAAGASRMIDATGMVVGPGLVDVHVHFRDPGFTYKEDLSTGAAAAAKGGFTSVVCMANTSPVMDNVETLRDFLQRAAKLDIHVHTIAAMSEGLHGKVHTDMSALLHTGALGFSDDGIPLMDTAFLREAMLAAKALDVPISLHEEDPALIGTAGIHDGEVARKLGLVGAPAAAESTMVARDCMLALETGARIHIQHLSCAASVELVRLAKRLGARVTAEVTPQHLSLTDQAVLEYGTRAKLNPPLRTEADRQALISGLADGTIDIIATDHAPHSAEEKKRPIDKAPSGLIGLETALALGITNLVRPGHLSLPTLLRCMTCSPAALYGLDAGQLRESGPADLVLFRTDETWTVDKFASKSANSPFIGKKLYGRVKATVCGGNAVYWDKEEK